MTGWIWASSSSFLAFFCIWVGAVLIAASDSKRAVQISQALLELVVFPFLFLVYLSIDSSTLINTRRYDIELTSMECLLIEIFDVGLDKLEVVLIRLARSEFTHLAMSCLERNHIFVLPR